MFKEGSGKRPLLVTLLSLFYAVATVVAIVAVAVLMSGREISMLPPGADAPGLAVETLIFLFMAYGLRKGWRSAWLVAMVMNIAWMAMDSRNYILGNLDTLVPIAIALASVAVLILSGTRRYFRISRSARSGS